MGVLACTDLQPGLMLCLLDGDVEIRCMIPCWSGSYLLVLNNKVGLQQPCKPMSLPRGTCADSCVPHARRSSAHTAAAGRCVDVDEWTHAPITNHHLPTLSKLSSASCCTNTSLLPASECTQFAPWGYRSSALGRQKARKPFSTSVMVFVFIT